MIACDPSSNGFGTVLFQQAEQGQKIIACAYRFLLEHEKKWGATELHAAALDWGVDTFRPSIHRVYAAIPAEYVGAKRERYKGLQPWLLPLWDCRFRFQARPASGQKHVNALSRATVPAEAGEQAITLDEFADGIVQFVSAWEEFWQQGKREGSAARRWGGKSSLAASGAACASAVLLLLCTAACTVSIGASASHGGESGR